MSAVGSAASCNHNIVSYRWQVVSGAAALIGSDADSTTTVSAPPSGTAVVRLTVTDENQRNDTADITLTQTSASTSAPTAAGAQACLAALSVPTSPVTVTITPSTATLQPGGTQTFAASVANTTNTIVAWQVDGVTGGSAAGGTITTAGVYTAPANVTTQTTVSIAAVWSGDSTKSAVASVTLQSGVATTKSAGGGGGGGALDGGLLALLACGALARRLRARNSS
jgi:hypothetical protein